MEKLTEKPKVCLIGAGNVATHLGKAFCHSCDVVQVLSRTEASARRLSDMMGGSCEAITDVAKLRREADLYVVSVTDDSVADIARETGDFGGVWVHTSGSVPASVFAGLKKQYGVLYPLQTFTRDVEVAMREVPFFVEGNTGETAEYISRIASLISDRVEIADSERRKKLHLAAVFACNFANQMWAEADDILHESGLSVGYLMPLLKATLAKIEYVSPKEAMTGPARRGDIEVMKAQMAQLDGIRRDIYQLISSRIYHEAGHKGDIFVASDFRQ